MYEGEIFTEPEEFLVEVSATIIAPAGSRYIYGADGEPYALRLADQRIVHFWPYAEVCDADGDTIKDVTVPHELADLTDVQFVDYEKREIDPQ